MFYHTLGNTVSYLHAYFLVLASPPLMRCLVRDEVVAESLLYLGKYFLLYTYLANGLYKCHLNDSKEHVCAYAHVCTL